MSGTQFAASVRRQARTVIIDLQGEIDNTASERLLIAYDQAERSAPEAIVLNFSQVHHINSAGIGLIIEMLSRANKGNRRMVAFGLTPHYTSIFRMTRLTDYIGLFSDEASALTAITPLSA